MVYFIPQTYFHKKSFRTVVVSCGNGTCFAVKTCDGLYSRVGGPQKLTRSTLELKLSVSPPYYPWVTATKVKGYPVCYHITRIIPGAPLWLHVYSFSYFVFIFQLSYADIYFYTEIGFPSFLGVSFTKKT